MAKSVTDLNVRMTADIKDFTSKMDSVKAKSAGVQDAINKTKAAPSLDMQRMDNSVDTFIKNYQTKMAREAERANVRAEAFKRMGIADPKIAQAAGREAAANTYKSYLDQLNSQFGKRSAFGKTLKLLAGGGVIGGIGLAASELDEMTRKMAEFADEIRRGSLSAGEMTEKFITAIPILGNIWDAGRNIREIFTGENAELQKMIAEGDAVNRVTDAMKDSMKAVEDATAKAQERISDIARELQRLQMTGKPLQLFDIDTETLKAVREAKKSSEEQKTGKGNAEVKRIIDAIAEQKKFIKGYTYKDEKGQIKKVKGIEQRENVSEWYDKNTGKKVDISKYSNGGQVDVNAMQAKHPELERRVFSRDTKEYTDANNQLKQLQSQLERAKSGIDQSTTDVVSNLNKLNFGKKLAALWNPADVEKVGNDLGGKVGAAYKNIYDIADKGATALSKVPGMRGVAANIFGGLADWVNKYANAIIVANKRNEQFTESMKAVQKQVDTFGMTGNQKELLDLKNQYGEKSPQYIQAKALFDQLDAKEKAAKENEERQRDRESVQTPQEKFEAEMKRIKNLYPNDLDMQVRLRTKAEAEFGHSLESDQGKGYQLAQGNQVGRSGYNIDQFKPQLAQTENPVLAESKRQTELLNQTLVIQRLMQQWMASLGMPVQLT